MPSLRNEQLFALLSELIRTAPKFEYEVPLGETEEDWIARASVAIRATGLIADEVAFTTAASKLNSYSHSRNDLMIPLRRAFHLIELDMPASKQGSFIPAGETWNGFAAIVKIIREAKKEVFLIDPYADSSLLVDFAPNCPVGIPLRCLSSGNYEAALASGLAQWRKDTANAARPVEIRIASKGELHDRLIVIDDSAVWVVTQSLKDVAAKSPASLMKADADLAVVKAQHYRELWAKSAELLLEAE